MSDLMPLFVFRPVVRQDNAERLVVRQAPWVGPFFYFALICQVLDLYRWISTWIESGWPGFWGLPWLTLALLCQWSVLRVRSLTLDRAAGVLRIAYFVGPSRQRPLSEVTRVELVVFNPRRTYSLVRLLLEGQRTVRLAVCGSRRSKMTLEIAEALATFLGVPRVEQDLIPANR